MKNWLKLCLVLVLVFTMSTGSALSALAAQMTLPAALKTVEAEAFAGDRSIDKVVLPDGTLSIGARAFADSTLTSITLPDTITAIADDAFEGSSGVTALVTAGSYAMRWCRRNNIPYQLTETPDEVVYGLDAVEEDLSIRHGYSFSVCIWRSHEYAGQDAEISFVDAAGNTVASETYADGKTERWLSFDSDALSPGTVTLTMAVDGVVLPGEQITFEVQESSFYFSSLYNRESKGTVRSLKVTFSADGYDCPVTFSIDNEDVASLSGNLLTYHSCGYVTVTAACAHGQTISRRVVVYDPASTLKPEFYIEPYAPDWYDEDDVYEPYWMDSVRLFIGTDDDLTQINQERFDVECEVEFLDADGNILCRDDYAYLYHSLLEPKDDTSWNDADVWLDAAKAGAVYIRFTLLEGKLYTVDPDRSVVTYPLPSLNTYPKPVVSFSYPESIEKGEAVEVTFECLNPASLGEGRPVGLLNHEDRTIVYDSGTLTTEQPIVTLTHTLTDEEWDEATGGTSAETGYFTLVYEISYPDGDYTAYDTIYITPGAVLAFGSDSKISIGGRKYLYSDYTGTAPDLTFSSTNSDVVAITEDYGSYVAVTGVSKGWSTVVATTPGGKDFSCRVTVYDPDNTVVPAVGFSNTQTAETARWNRSISLNVETATAPEDFGSISLNLLVDYLNESGSVVASGTATARPSRYFTRSEDTISFTPSTAEMGMAYAGGARSVRISIAEGSCTPISGKASIILPIEDPDAASKPIVYMQAPQYAVRGEVVDVSITCVNPSLYGADRYVYTLYDDNINEPLATMILSADEPSASASITIPNISMYSFSPYEARKYRLNLSGDWGGYVGNIDITVLDGSIGDIGKLSVGSSAELSYSLTTVDGLTVSFESSDPSVASVDASGNVTAVAPGLFGITMTYGPVVETVYGRVYSDSPVGVPELTLYNYDPEAAFAPSQTFYLGVSITDGIESVGSYQYVYYTMDYLNDDGEVVYSYDGSSYMGFDSGAEAKFYVSESYRLYTAVLNGATSVRFSLRESEKYTISDAYAPFTAPIADTGEWYGTHIGYDYNSLTTRGAEETITISLLAASDKYTGVDATVTFRVYDGRQYFIDGETRVISTDNPTCQLTFTVPETATRLECNYTIKFEGDDSVYSSNMIRPDLLYFYSEQADTTLTVGSTLKAIYSYNLNNMAVSYESSDPEVASVTDSGVVTGVSTGIATITAHIGPAVRTFDVRVYDANGTFAEPELYLFNPDPSQTVYSSNNFRIGVGTSTDVRQLAGRNSFTMRYDFVDADGKVVYSGSSSGSTFNAAFAAESETTLSTYVGSSTFFSAAAAGATHVRYTLMSKSGYTVDESRSSVLIPLRDPSEWGITKILACKAGYLYTNDAFSAQVKLLSLSESDAEETYTVKLTAYDNNGHYYHTDAEQTLSAESPVASFPIPAVDDSVTYIQFSCSVTRDSDGYSILSDSWNASYARLTAVQSDMLLKVGASQYANYSGTNISYVPTTYTSSNPAVATIDNSRYVKGVSAGTAQITVTFGELSHTFTVRVYDSTLTYAEPEVHFSDSSDAYMDENGNTYFFFGTDSSVSELGGPVSVSFTYQYLDAEGSGLYAAEPSTSISVGFASSVSRVNKTMSDSMHDAVASGATHLRLTLKEGTGYTIDPERSTVTIPIPAVSDWQQTHFGLEHADLYYSGDAATVSVKLLSCEEQYADYDLICTLNVRSGYSSYIVDSVEKPISMSNPASYTFEVPNYSPLSIGYSIRCADESVSFGYSDSVSANVVYPSSVPGDTLMKVGSTKQLSYSVVNSAYVPVSYESSNPEVASLDENLLLTAVSAGTATITARYGELELSFGVRVYDASAEHATPELSLSAVPGQTGLTPSSTSIRTQVVSSVDPAELGGNISGRFLIEYVTGEGDVLYSTTYSSTLTFTTSPVLTVTPSSVSYAAHYVAAGMTAVRVTLQPYTGYTVAEGADSVLVPVADPSSWGTTTFGVGAPAGAIPGKEYTVPVRMLSCAEADLESEYTVRFKLKTSSSSSAVVYYESEDVLISASSPTAEFTFTVPENLTSSCYMGYTITTPSGGTINNGMDVRLYYLSSAPTDKVIAVNGTVKSSISVTNSSYLPYTMTYESSSPEVASVDASGVVTGVSTGVAQIIARFGDLETGYSVRVYDSSSITAAKLSLSAPETLTEWGWDFTGDLIITADQPVESLGSVSSAYVYSYYYDAANTMVGSTSKSISFNFIDSNTAVISIANNLNTATLMSKGAVTVKHSLSASGTGISVNADAQIVTLPMQDPAEYPDPLLQAGSLSSSDWLSGREYTLDVTAANAAYPYPVTVQAAAKLNGSSGDYTELGSITFTPAADGAAQTLTIAAPEATLSSLTLYIRLIGEDDAVSDLKSYSVKLLTVTEATTLAELQSAHNYADSIAQAWLYTVEGAVSLSVTLDSQTVTEANYDKLYIGTEDELMAGSFASGYLSGTIGAKTVEVTGDTVAIKLTTDTSSTRWGFAVAQIVATMADGSTVTITE